MINSKRRDKDGKQGKGPPDEADKHQAEQRDSWDECFGWMSIGGVVNIKLYYPHIYNSSFCLQPAGDAGQQNHSKYTEKDPQT